MKFLLDTNIIIPIEPTSQSGLEDGTHISVQLLRSLAQGGHQAYIHEASLIDLQKDKNKERWKMRQILLKKYLVLEKPPLPSSHMVNILGTPPSTSHDFVDHHLLAALEADAVDFLITEDIGIHKKAKHLELQERVATPSEAIAIVEALFPQKSSIHNTPVEHLPAYNLNEKDPIFVSFRNDYSGFDKWLQKCKREHRDTWVIKTFDGAYQGIAIVKEEKSYEYGLKGKILKICSFKILESSRGTRLGELLLKPLFDYAVLNNFDHIFLEVFHKQKELIVMLEAFGFAQLPQPSNKGEFVMVKKTKPTEGDKKNLTALDYHVKFGPYYINPEKTAAYIVPILPRYHRMLFPESEPQPQLSFFQGEHSYGNSIRKAYLCHSSIRKIQSGDLLFFYLSKTRQEIACLGVVEQTYVSNNTADVARFVAKRTVYSYPEIEQMCDNGDVLSVLFRQSRIFKSPIKLDELITNNALKTAPQSITTVPEEASAWLLKRVLKLR